jgi:glutathione S-transferase
MSVPTIPTLFVCHGDDGGPPFHPCRQAQEALRSAGIEYRKVVAGRGSPFPFLRGPRPELLRETGTEKLPTLKLTDGAVLIDVPAIRYWINKGGAE